MRSAANSDWGRKPLPEPSQAKIYPHLELGAAMVANAVKDLTLPDPVRALDALVWLVYGDGPLWLEALIGRELGPEEMLACLKKV